MLRVGHGAWQRRAFGDVPAQGNSVGPLGGLVNVRSAARVSCGGGGWLAGRGWQVRDGTRPPNILPVVCGYGCGMGGRAPRDWVEAARTICFDCVSSVLAYSHTFPTQYRGGHTGSDCKRQVVGSERGMSPFLPLVQCVHFPLRGVAARFRALRAKIRAFHQGRGCRDGRG